MRGRWRVHYPSNRIESFENENSRTLSVEVISPSKMLRSSYDLKYDLSFILGEDSSYIAQFLKYASEGIFGVAGRCRQSQPRHLIIFTNGKFDGSSAAVQQAAKKLKR